MCLIVYFAECVRMEICVETERISDSLLVAFNTRTGGGGQKMPSPPVFCG